MILAHDPREWSPQYSLGQFGQGTIGLWSPPSVSTDIRTVQHHSRYSVYLIHSPPNVNHTSFTSSCANTSVHIYSKLLSATARRP